MAEQEKKPEVENPTPPAGSEGNTTPAPNPGPSVDELLKQKEELEAKLKERDTKIADLETTNATIAARQRDVDAAKAKQTTDADLKRRISQINERRAYDPEGADAEMASLFAEVKSQSTDEAVKKAQAAMTQQTTLEKLRTGVKSSNPEFDDDIADLVMAKANEFATTGRYKTADEAIKAATDFVKSKLDSYAQKKNAVPQLPPGARAENGGSNQPPKPPEPEKEKTALDEIEEFNTAKARKSL